MIRVSACLHNVNTLSRNHEIKFMVVSTPNSFSQRSNMYTVHVVSVMITGKSFLYILMNIIIIIIDLFIKSHYVHVITALFRQSFTFKDLKNIQIF